MELIKSLPLYGGFTVLVVYLLWLVDMQPAEEKTKSMKIKVRDRRMQAQLVTEQPTSLKVVLSKKVGESQCVCGPSSRNEGFPQSLWVEPSLLDPHRKLIRPKQLQEVENPIISRRYH